MKWLLLVVALLCVYPLGRLLRRWPGAWGPAACLLGLLPLVGIEAFDINLSSLELYRGDARGFEITLVDLIVVSMAIALPRGAGPGPYRLARGLYLLAATASMLLTPEPLLSLFGIWKLLRMYVLVSVVARAARAPRFASGMLTGLGLGVIFQALLCVWQRYGLAAYQAQGSFSHPNSLGMASNLVGAVALALCLAKGARWLSVATALSAGAAVLLTLSRASMALGAAAALMVLGFSLSAGLSARARKAALVMALLGLGVGARALPTILERFRSAPAESSEARSLFNEAARAMLLDHPLGVGINQFSNELLTSGYAEQVGLRAVDRDGLVHHIYWLTAAEMGYFGLFAYLLVIGGPLLLAIDGAIRQRRTTGGALLLGCAVGLSATYIQGAFEWAPRQTSMSYLFWMIAGLIVAIRTLRPALGARLVSA